MSKRYDRFRAMFYVLETHQHRREPVTLEALAHATGYKLSSIRTYHAKHLKGRVLFARDQGPGYDVRGLESHDADSFITLMTAGTPRDAAPPPATPDIPPEPISTTRAPALANAEALLKGALRLYHADDTGACQAMFVRGLEEAWVWLLRAQEDAGAEREALVAGLEEVPLRRNLEWVMSLTRGWSDALVPEVLGPLTRLYQACVLNFRRRFEAVSGRPLLARGEGLLVLGGGQESWDADACELRCGSAVRGRVEELLRALTIEEVTLHAGAFVTPGRYRVELERQDLPTRARRVVSASIRQRIYALDAATTVQAINARLSYAHRLTPSVLPLLDRHLIGDPNVSEPLSWRDADTGQMRYAAAYVDWVVDALEGDREFLERVARVGERLRS